MIHIIFFLYSGTFTLIYIVYLFYQFYTVLVYILQFTLPSKRIEGGRIWSDLPPLDPFQLLLLCQFLPFIPELFSHLSYHHVWKRWYVQKYFLRPRRRRYVILFPLFQSSTLIPTNLTPPQGISRVNSPPQHPKTSSHPQSNKKSIQLVAEGQGTWPTTILIDQRSRAKVKTSNPLHYGRNKCPTIPDEVCEALNTFKANKKGWKECRWD